MPRCEIEIGPFYAEAEYIYHPGSAPTRMGPPETCSVKHVWITSPMHPDLEITQYIDYWPEIEAQCLEHERDQRRLRA